MYFEDTERYFEDTERLVTEEIGMLKVVFCICVGRRRAYLCMKSVSLSLSSSRRWSSLPFIIT